MGPLRFLDGLEVEKLRARSVDVLAIPCGSCLGCRLDRADSWTMRIMHEASLHDENSFVTLTYDDEHLPHGNLPTLSTRDFQLFCKRVRKTGRKVRYFAAGEYGGTTGRPHYHAIFFGWRPAFRSQVTSSTYDSAELEELWSCGGATAGNVTVASAAYVAQYSMKKQVGKDARSEGRHPEGLLMSNGIGLGWLRKYAGDLNNGYIIHEGRKRRIPRYYFEKKGDIDPEWYLLQKLDSRADRRDPELQAKTADDILERRGIIHESKRKFFGSSSREPNQVRQ